MRYGLQLWSIRDYINDAKSFVKALKKVKEIGYDGVEFAGGYQGLPAIELKKILEEINLVPISTHMSYWKLEKDMDEILEYASDLGLKRVTMSNSFCTNPTEIKNTIDVLIKTQDSANKYGIEISYHNHLREFMNQDGVIPIEEFQKYTNIELDCFHCLQGGGDPLEFMKKYKKKVTLLHLKDGKLSEEHSCRVGLGEVDILGCIKYGNSEGLEWGIVENDQPKGDSIEDAKSSLEWIKDNV